MILAAGLKLAGFLLPLCKQTRFRRGRIAPDDLPRLLVDRTTQVDANDTSHSVEFGGNVFTVNVRYR